MVERRNVRTRRAGFFSVLACALAVTFAPACSVLRHPTPARSCPRSPAHASRVENFLVVGHRGAAAKEVENTIPSMERAVREGANAVETDLSLTKDGHIVLWHDWNPNEAISLTRQWKSESTFAHPRVPALASAFRKPVDELTLDELRQNYGYTVNGKDAPAEIPTLEQFLDWAVSRPQLLYVLFDLKVPADKADLVDTIITHVLTGMRERRAKFKYVFLTPHEPVYQRASALIDGDELAFDVDEGVVLIDDNDCDDASSRRAAKRGRGYASTVAAQGLSAEAWHAFETLLSCDVEARDRTRATRKVFAATVNEKDKMECLVDMGVDGVLSDNPALLRAVADERRAVNR